MTTYSIMMIRNSFQPDMQGIGAPQIVRDNDNNPLQGLTLDKARDAVRELDQEIYVTSNNESTRPDYYIVDDDTADYIDSGRNADGGNYDWDSWENACQSPRDGRACGECQGCIELRRGEDQAYIRKNAIN